MATPTITNIYNLITNLSSGQVGEVIKITGTGLTQPNLWFNSGSPEATVYQNTNSPTIVYNTEGF